MESLEGLHIQDNVINNCGTGIMLMDGYDVTTQRNEILNCNFGIDVLQCSGLRLLSNRILGAYVGARLSMVRLPWGLRVSQNIVGQCSSDAFSIVDSEDAHVERNTLFNNGGSGIVVTGSESYAMAIGGNISVGNGGWGLLVPSAGEVQLGWNAGFGSSLGQVSGAGQGSTDWNVDPMFCMTDSVDVRLNAASPLLSGAGCGQVRALGVGCGETPTLVRRFMAARGSEGVRVTWEFAEEGTASEIWLERSEAMESMAWTRPYLERSYEDGAVVELDREAAPDRTYWYRLMALEGSDFAVIGGPVIVEAQTRVKFRLTDIGPNPAGGPVSIGFALEREAVVEIDIFDVQGRRVASPGRGTWRAGTHAVDWDGRNRSGENAPAGMYVVRYFYPGGHDRRAIVRIR